MLAKENLSTPLLLGIALCAIRIARGERPAGTALVAGLLWGAALVTGGSALLLCFGVAPALLMLWRARHSFAPAFSAGLSSEEHTTELQSLMRNSYAVFCLKKNTQPTKK